MKIFNAKKLLSADPPKLLEYAGKESVLVSFRDQCYTAIIPAFIGQLNNALPIHKQCIHLRGSIQWGNPDYTAHIERQIREEDAAVTGAIVLDHFRQFLVTEDDDQALINLKHYFDRLASSIEIPLIILYRYAL